MTDPPPPYTGTPTPLNSNPQTDPLTQLRRYLIEILIFTFNADIAPLNQALNQAPSSPSPSKSSPLSILTQDEQSCLLHLSHLTQTLYKKRKRTHRWLTTHSTDRQTLKNAIVIPSRRLGLSPAYILNLISTYADHQCDTTARKQTLLSRNIPHGLCIRRYMPFFLYTFSDHLNAHTNIIRAVAPNDQVRMELDKAMEGFKQELGIRKVASVMMEHWPQEYGRWCRLWQSLISWVEYSSTPIEASIIEASMRDPEAAARSWRLH